MECVRKLVTNLRELTRKGKRSVGGKRRMSILNMGDNQNIENVAYYSI